MCEQSSIWIEIAKGMPTAFVALIIGLVAAYIAWHQYQVAKSKLKLDLFEKRYAIFEHSWRFMSEAVQIGATTGPLSQFDNLIPQAEFLFGNDVAEYLREASRKRTELWMILQKSKSSYGMSEDDIERDKVLTNWFFEEASKGVKQVFGPYLDFKTWR